MAWVTRREQLVSQYDKEAAEKNKPYIISTKPYHSTVCLPWQVVDANTAQGFAWAVCEKGTVLDFFGYGIGETNVPFGPTARKATDADTNISKAKNTNGAASFVVEGISLSCRGRRVEDGGSGGT